MTTQFLVQDIERDEGSRTNAYQDSRGLWTIGVGHHDKSIHKGMVWTEDQIGQQLDTDINLCKRGLDNAIFWWRKIDDVRQDVLVNMAFNLGVGGLLEFHDTLAHVQAGEWNMAAMDILVSKAAVELPERYGRLAEQMKCGERS